MIAPVSTSSLDRVSELRVVDSSAKMVDGILSGSMTFLGIYDQCLNTTVPDPKMKEKALFRGQYCLTEIRSPLPPKTRRYKLYDEVEELRNFSGTEVVKFLSTKAHFHYIVPFRAGLCVPSGCSKDDLSQLLSIVSEKLLLNFHVSHCEVKKEEIKFSEMQIFTIIICCFLATLVLLGTWLEFRSKLIQTRGMPYSSRQMIPDMLDWRQIWGSRRPKKGSNSAETVL
ncbi:NRF domain-containing protein [Trichonephila clavipes]|nr:NRF domain-containing protein [Trichonephila clavipes]